MTAIRESHSSSVDICSTLSLEFINHASFLLDYRGTRIVSDPWLFGSAFNNGWDLVSETHFEPERFAEVDYLWFSHEHPDHFSPPVLKAIPETIREGITVLFQQTRDRKVVEFCRRLGFGIQELPDGKPVELTRHISVTCGKVPFFDSWLLFDLEGTKILNINDCIVDGDGVAEEIHAITGNVDLLLTQFSYAAWKGNRNDRALRKESAASKLEIVKSQISVFHPEWTIPFASFIYFSHEENRYNNDSINHPEDAVAAINETDSIPVLLYPGDCWEYGTEWQNEPALDRYAKDYHLESKKYHTSESESVDEAALIASADGYVERIYQKNSRWMLDMVSRLPLLPFFRPITLLISDHDQLYTFSFRNGLTRNGEASSLNDYDVKMHSSSLDYVFRFDWGYDTLTVNGRFECDMNGFGRMTRTFAIGPLNNTGRFVKPALFLDYRIIMTFLRALSRFSQRLRRHGVGRR